MHFYNRRFKDIIKYWLRFLLFNSLRTFVVFIKLLSINSFAYIQISDFNEEKMCVCYLVILKLRLSYATSRCLDLQCFNLNTSLYYFIQIYKYLSIVLIASI